MRYLELELEKDLILNRGGDTDSSEGKTENKKHPAAKPKDFSAFIPFDKTRERIKLNCQNITDAFIEGSLAEFITYAEAHYRPVQLQSKFIKSVTSDFKYRELNGQCRKAESKVQGSKGCEQGRGVGQRARLPDPETR